jgi:hypothetical protein
MASEVGSSEWRERKSVNTVFLAAKHKYLMDRRKQWIIKGWNAMCVEDGESNGQ